MWMRPGGGGKGYTNPPVPFYSNRKGMGHQFYLYPRLWVLFGGTVDWMWLRLPWVSISISKEM